MFLLLEFPELEKQSLPSLTLRKRSKKTMTEMDLYLLLPILAQSTVGPGTATPGDLTTGIPASSEGEQGETAIGTIGDKEELGGKAEEGGKGEV